MHVTPQEDTPFRCFQHADNMRMSLAEYLIKQIAMLKTSQFSEGLPVEHYVAQTPFFGPSLVGSLA